MSEALNQLCHGRRKDFSRCRKACKGVFCIRHRWQLPALLVSLITLIATGAGLYRDMLEPWFEDKTALKFSGEIGHFEKGLNFEKFLLSNQSKIVELDCYIPTTAGVDVSLVEGSSGEETSEFSIRTATAAYESGEEAFHSNSSGVTVLVYHNPKTSAVFGLNAGQYMLKGLYEIMHLTGTNNGYWYATLRPVAREHLRY